MKPLPILASLLGIVTVALLPASPAYADAPSQTLKSALVTAVDRAGIYSGVVAAWDRLVVETQAGATMNLFSRAFGEQDALPRAGQRCDVRYHMGQYDGVGPGLKASAPFPIVEDFTCAPTSDQPSPPSP